MTYEEICKYVFMRENVAWDIHDSKKRDRELVVARQISMYLGNYYYPKITWTDLAKVFNRDHATAMHSVKTVKNLMYSHKETRSDVYDYMRFIEDKLGVIRNQEIKAITKLKDQDTMKALLQVIDKMEFVAKLYCEITDKKIIAN